MEYYDRVIPLGMDCGVASSLMKAGFREFACPFDWNVATLPFIIDSIATQFNNFDEVLRPGKLRRGCNRRSCHCMHYNEVIHFPHESLEQPETLRRKYLRRGARLHSLLGGHETVLFVRKAPNDSKNDISKLCETIGQQYPDLRYRVLLINNIRDETFTHERVLHAYKELECFLRYDGHLYEHRNKAEAMTVSMPN